MQNGGTMVVAKGIVFVCSQIIFLITICFKNITILTILSKARPVWDKLGQDAEGSKSQG